MTPAVESIRPAWTAGLKQVIENQTMPLLDFVIKLAHDAEAVAKDRAPYEFGNLMNSIKVSPPKEFFGG